MRVPGVSHPAETRIVKPVAKRPMGKGKPPPRGNTLGALSAAESEADNKRDNKKTKETDKTAKVLSKKRTEPLNFRVAADFRRAFKRAAAAQDCKKVELLERIFAEWSARNPA